MKRNARRNVSWVTSSASVRSRVRCHAKRNTSAWYRRTSSSNARRSPARACWTVRGSGSRIRLPLASCGRDSVARSPPPSPPYRPPQWLGGSLRAGGTRDDRPRSSKERDEGGGSMRRLIAGLVMTAAAVVLVGGEPIGAGASGGGGCGRPVSDARGTGVRIEDFCFLPTVVRIHTGQAVTVRTRERG